MPLPNSLFYSMSNRQALTVQQLIIKNTILVRSYKNQYSRLKEYGNSHFLGKIFFRDGWVIIDNVGDE